MSENRDVELEAETATGESLELNISEYPDDSEDGFQMVPMEDLELMSAEDCYREKKLLEEKRRRLSLYIDGEKLEHAKIIIDNTRMILDRMAENLLSKKPSSFDAERYSNAYEKMIKSLERVTRLDSLDGSGTVKRIYLEIHD